MNLRFLFLLPAGIFAMMPGAENARPLARPNFILVMADDQGWGDVGFNGHPVLKTPQFDAMARAGVRLERFYAAAPVCSPTRGSCLTGRHPSRYGINWASEGKMPAGEMTLAEALRDAGYATGHFGKWHLGQLSRTLRQGRKNQLEAARYAPPWEHGFATCFTTEGNVPTFNPYFYTNTAERVESILQQDAETVGTAHRWAENYWTGPGRFVDEPLEGDDSQLIMDRALEFIRGAADRPFFACIWFHTPHTPVAAGRESRRLYGDLPVEQQHFYGSISAMDAQVGRLRSELRRLDRADDTVVFFCSDNGPSYVHPHGSAGDFRGRKASLLEGGIRVPALVEWPRGFSGGRVVRAPLSTSDYYPTIVALAGARVARQPALDGRDVRALLAGTEERRGAPIFFHSPLKNENDPWARADAHQAAVQTDRHKLLTLDSGRTWALYDMLEDPKEEKDLAAGQAALVGELRARWEQWRTSCLASAKGADYR
jgi:arylsulfatase A-like enzyme